ncbi:Iron import ATP-binding/permease protein IrtA [Mycobacterium talmoniae]|uniref:Iron import ATP-binding/permease protein IrtA n=1 Tax=Mycobacterium talmoniae TaxID=1858794 RepID=A0A2S8BGJ2_9MYCO|nr:Iron import ATP-binding/permease protein IrtA [Mycobacterium talmoniae]
MSFGYRPGVPVISDVALTLRPGTVTALVGPSGSGKSTLAALLARFHDIDHGAIRVDGHDIRSLSADELYRRVGFVLQDTQLVHGTVRDNIALAVPDASLEQVQAAARDAQIHDRVLRLPDGYDTVLGASTALSGGNANGSPSPARSWPTRRCSSSTRPPPSPTPNRNTWCSKRLTD